PKGKVDPASPLGLPECLVCPDRVVHQRDLPRGLDAAAERRAIGPALAAADSGRTTGASYSLIGGHGGIRHVALSGQPTAQAISSRAAVVSDHRAVRGGALAPRAAHGRASGQGGLADRESCDAVDTASPRLSAGTPRAVALVEAAAPADTAALGRVGCDSRGVHVRRSGARDAAPG